MQRLRIIDKSEGRTPGRKLPMRVDVDFASAQLQNRLLFPQNLLQNLLPPFLRAIDFAQHILQNLLPQKVGFA